MTTCCFPLAGASRATQPLEAALLFANGLYGYCKVIQATGSALIKVYALCSDL